ncbi:hypothetical protein [Saccharopolyspora rosea]|uniref:Uncharacterized protein n=1 Tax=Saccharopolyspora rosea TaxID=524884 RepID=A0ABW3FTZ6_9PSEU|nr:hypothetical protein [Saccharopolyspora rosea]
MAGGRTALIGRNGRRLLDGPGHDHRVADGEQFVDDVVEAVPRCTTRVRDDQAADGFTAG